jgi:penicillin-insensitive murein endopeptidase
MKFIIKLKLNILNKVDIFIKSPARNARIETTDVKLCVRSLFASSLLLIGSFADAESTCYGTLFDGALNGGVQVTQSGPNFEVMRWKNARPRLFLHSGVKKILDDTFAALEVSIPDAKFLIGETGMEHGGTLSGHDTHKNGLSVDLFLPVRDAKDGSRILFINDFRNGYGYKEKFDDINATSEDGRMVIDFEALSEYIYQLNEASKRNGYRIYNVHLTSAFHEKVMAENRGPYIRSNVKLMADPPNRENYNGRHDNHIHVNFDISCMPSFFYKKQN